MPATPLQRLMFIQGQLCFFCNSTIPKTEASVEHLVPVSANGSDHPDNLVACCKTLNALFGSMSVKDKIRVILNQKGKFICPNQQTQAQMHPQPSQTPAKIAQSNGVNDTNIPINQGCAWTPDEDKQLAAAFDAQAPLPELADRFKRSIKSIEFRLIRLGKITPEQQTISMSESKAN